jgi:hypothetical protein
VRGEKGRKRTVMNCYNNGWVCGDILRDVDVEAHVCGIGAEVSDLGKLAGGWGSFGEAQGADGQDVQKD